MTLQQLKYVVATAEKGTVSEAAQSLFISQPSLTNAIRELEKEMNITIFIRTNKGITVSKEGEVFLGYARQVLEQASLLEEKYCGKQHGKRQFCISTQHYSFAVNAFVDLIKEFGGDEYDFSIRETQTHEIIEDVARMKSELGILYLNDFNEPVLSKEIKSKELKFTELFSAKPHVFVGSANPLAKKKSVTLEDLQAYPYLSFEQGEYNSFYYSEEIFSRNLLCNGWVGSARDSPTPTTEPVPTVAASAAGTHTHDCRIEYLLIASMPKSEGQTHHYNACELSAFFSISEKRTSKHKLLKKRCKH